MTDGRVSRRTILGAAVGTVGVFAAGVGTGLSVAGDGFETRSGKIAVSVTVVDNRGGEEVRPVPGAEVMFLNQRELVMNGITSENGQVSLSGVESGEGDEYELRIDTPGHDEWSGEMTLEQFEDQYPGESPGLVASITNTITRTNEYNLRIDISEAEMEDEEAAGAEDEPQPEFGIVEFDVPENPEMNVESEVFVDVENTGDDSSVVFVDLIADNTFAGSTEREIEPGRLETIVFGWTPEEAGEMELTVELTPEGADEPVVTARETVEVTEADS